MYANPNSSAEDIVAAYRAMATRPPGESGTPPASQSTPCTKTSQECLATRLEHGQLRDQLIKATIRAEQADELLKEAVTKLMLTEGVTANVRQEELMRKLQGIFVGMQNNIENLEAEVGHLKKQVRFLESSMDENVYTGGEWTEFEAPVKDVQNMERTWASLTGGDGTQV